MTQANHAGEANQVDGAAYRFDVKALRLATHGWLLGNPLVYKPGAADLTSIARELAEAGSASGTLVLGAAGAEGVEAILLLRLALSRAALGEASATAIADVAREASGGSCSVEERDGEWVVLTMDDARSTVIARVTLETEGGGTLLGLRLTFGALWEAGHDAGGALAAPLLARSDWREVFLARVLHALDIRLRALSPA